MLRASLLISLLLSVSCGSSSKGPASSGEVPVENVVAEEGGGGEAAPGARAGVVEGALWTCQIDDYEPQPCKFHQEGGAWHLTKVMGSQRFAGVVTFGDGELRLVGELFCPWGDCNTPVDATLTHDGAAYVGTVDNSQVRIWWDEGNAGEYGGAGYGGLSGREM